MTSAVAVVAHSKHITLSSTHSLDGVRRFGGDRKHGEIGDKPTNFSINFQNSDFTQGQIVRLQLMDIWIPNLFYNVTESNRRFSLSSNADGIIYIDMPLGHYTVDEYIEELSAQLATLGTTLQYVSHSIDPITGVLSIVMNGEWIKLAVYDTSLPDLNIDNTPVNRLLGHTSNSGAYPFGITAIDNGVGGWVVTFPSPPMFYGPQCVMLECGSLTSSNTTIIGEKSVSSQLTLIDMISLSETSHGGIVHHKPLTENIRALSFAAPVQMNNLHFRLLDINGKQLELPPNAEVCIHLLVSHSSISNY